MRCSYPHHNIIADKKLCFIWCSWPSGLGTCLWHMFTSVRIWPFTQNREPTLCKLFVVKFKLWSCSQPSLREDMVTEKCKEYIYNLNCEYEDWSTYENDYFYKRWENSRFSFWKVRKNWYKCKNFIYWVRKIWKCTQVAIRGETWNLLVRMSNSGRGFESYHFRIFLVRFDNFPQIWYIYNIW